MAARRRRDCISSSSPRTNPSRATGPTSRPSPGSRSPPPRRVPGRPPSPTGWEAAASEPWVAYFDAGTRLVHPDGTGEHQIAADFPGNLILPDWSPDGQRLAMTSRDTGGTESIYEYDLRTGSYRQLFACDDPCLGDDELAYSPDGTKVVFDRALGPWTDTGPTDCGLWVGDLASGEVTQVTSNPGCYREYFPRWSPDGSQLAYWRWQEDPPGVTTGTAVFVIDADGTDERQLTDWAVMARRPRLVARRRVARVQHVPPASVRVPPGGSNLYRMRPDGTGTEQLTFNADTTHRATQPRYTPDGGSIVFTADWPETRTISVMPADGGESRVVVDRGTHADVAARGRRVPGTSERMSGDRSGQEGAAWMTAGSTQG